MAGFADRLYNFGSNMQQANNPTWARLAEDQRRNDMLMEEHLRAIQKEEALRQLAGLMEGNGAVPTTPGTMGPLQPQDPIDRETALKRYAGISGDFDPLFSPGASNLGGATGVLVDRLMKENPGLSFSDALAQVQTGYRKGVTFEGGTATPIDGLGSALGALAGEENYGKTAGGLQAEGEYKPQVEYDVTKAGEDAKKQSEREANIGTVEENAQNMLNTIDAALEDKPGMEAATGGILGMQGRQSATLPLSAEQRRYQPIVDQIRGQTFLEAFQRLKGGGAITEVEGTKGEAAIARLNQAQETKDFEAALKELRGIVEKGVERAKSGVAKGAEKSVQQPGAEDKTPARKVISFGDLQ